MCERMIKYMLENYLDSIRPCAKKSLETIPKKM